MRIQVPEKFSHLLWDNHRFLILCGGAGSGKSEFTARKIIYRCLTEGNHRFLILRKFGTSLIGSVIKVFLEILTNENIDFKYNKTLREISFINGKGERNELIFSGLDDPEKLKSFKGATSIWLEELSEFNENDFNQINLRLRGYTKYYKQIIGSLNPDQTEAEWVKIRFFDEKDKDSIIHHSTVYDNPFILENDPEYVRELEKIIDPVLRSIYLKGIWMEAKGLVFPKFKIIRPQDIPLIYERFYGLDFGYATRHPNALIEISVGIQNDRETYHLRELLYQSGQTTGDLINSLKSLLYNKSCLIIADSAEQDRIDEITLAGFNIVGAKKGPGSVIDQCRFLNQIWNDMYSIGSNIKLHKERSGYKWPENIEGKPDKKSNPIAAFGDHLISGLRYAMSHKLKVKYLAGKQMVKTYKRPDWSKMDFRRI